MICHDPSPAMGLVNFLMVEPHQTESLSLSENVVEQNTQWTHNVREKAIFVVYATEIRRLFVIAAESSSA